MMPPLVHVESNILPPAKLVVVLCALAFSLLVSFIDQNSVSVALPVLGRELDAATTISWAGTSSLIANTVFQVLYGRISDIVGRKPVLLACIGLLTLGDILCGFAKTGPELYVYRGITGVGNGGIAALAMIIMSDVVTLEQRGKYQGILGACVGLGNIIGPFMAAAIVNNWQWRALFWIVCGLAFSSGVVVLLFVPQSKVTGGGRNRLRAVDWPGLATSSAGLILLLIPITSGGADFAWSSPLVISMLVVGSVLMIAFILIEWLWAVMPLLPLRFFGMPQVCVIMIQNILIGVVYYSSLYFLPVYYQNARQWSLMRAAILTIPMVASQTVTSVLSGLYISHFKRYGEVIYVGYASWALGAGLTLLFRQDTEPWVIVLVLLIQGSGVGLIFQPTLIAVQACTAKEDRAVITSVRNFTRAMGGAVGIAISTAILSSRVSSGLESLPDDAKARIMNQVLAVPDISLLDPEQGRTVLAAYTKGCRSIFILWLSLQSVCLALCIIIRDRGLKRPDEVADAITQGFTTEDTESTDIEMRPATEDREEKVATVLEKTVGPETPTSHQLVAPCETRN